MSDDSFVNEIKQELKNKNTEEKEDYFRQNNYLFQMKVNINILP